MPKRKSPPMVARKSKGERLYEAFNELLTVEEIERNMMNAHGRIPRALAERIQNAQFSYALAKDDAKDPYMKD